MSSSLVDTDQSNILHQTQQLQHTNKLYGVIYFKTDENRCFFCRLLTRTQQQLNESIVVATAQQQQMIIVETDFSKGE
jgi:hypothetical protein